jgi:hypothetical protein
MPTGRWGRRYSHLNLYKRGIMYLHSLKNYLSLITISLFLFTCQKQTQYLRQAIELSGRWQFSIDSADVGIQQKWYLADPEDVIELPGTTDLHGTIK